MEKYKIIQDIKSNWLYKDDMIELEKTLLKGIDKFQNKELSYELIFEDSSMKFHSVEEIIKVVNTNKLINEIYINVIIRENNDMLSDIIKSIRISLCNLYNYISITSDDSVWMYGMKDVLIKFFDERKNIINKYFKLFFYSPSVVIGIVISRILTSLISQNYFQLLGICTLLIIVILLYKLLYKPYIIETKISLTDKPNLKLGEYLTILSIIIPLLIAFIIYVYNL